MQCERMWERRGGNGRRGEGRARSVRCGSGSMVVSMRVLGTGGREVIFMWETINIMEAYKKKKIFFAPGTEKKLGIGLVSCQAEVHYRAVRVWLFCSWVI